MSVSVTWYGHSNFKVSCGDVTVFIDPFFTHNPSCPVQTLTSHPYRTLPDAFASSETDI